MGRRQAGHRTQQKGPSEGVGAWGVAEGQVSAHLFPGPDTHVPEPCHPPQAPPEGGLDVTSPGSRCPTAQIQPDFTVSSATWLFFLPPMSPYLYWGIIAKHSPESRGTPGFALRLPPETKHPIRNAGSACVCVTAVVEYWSSQVGRTAPLRTWTSQSSKVVNVVPHAVKGGEGGDGSKLANQLTSNQG